MNTHPSHRLFLAAAAGERPGARRQPSGEELGVRLPEKVSVGERPTGWAEERRDDLPLGLQKLGHAGVPAR